ncbi:MAG: TetR family transcriptional regulator [Gammaproteobacteria bacterium]|nr:TetR family transcriptional regulator [Gammaproteobacteria bacterium]
MTTARSKLTPTSERTREQLILAGERLFAQSGLDSVSLRQINNAAGQRNSSAAHYHFGSKDALVRAIYEYRGERINQRRSAMLARMSAQECGQVRPLIKALVHPIVAEIEETEGGGHSIIFLSQLYSNPALDLMSMWRSHLSESVGTIYQHMREVLPEIPEEVAGMRFGLMWVAMINTLADRQRLMTTRASETAVARTLPVLFVSNVIDMLCGAAAAPLSADTLAELNELRAATRQ